MDKKKKTNKRKRINIKDIGINFDKNEYREIVLSQSNRPHEK